MYMKEELHLAENLTYTDFEEQEVLCRCGHDVEEHNSVWKHITACDKCECTAWDADIK